MGHNLIKTQLYDELCLATGHQVFLEFLQIHVVFADRFAIDIVGRPSNITRELLLVISSWFFTDRHKNRNQVRASVAEVSPVAKQSPFIGRGLLIAEVHHDAIHNESSQGSSIVVFPR